MHVTPRSRACDQARSLASLRLDDELSELEHALLDAHLGACAACAAFTVDIESATAQLRRAPLARLDHSLILPSTHRRHGYLRGLQTAAAGAVAAAAVVAGFIAVTPVVTDPSNDRAATRFSEPVSVRWELQLRRYAQPSEGPSGPNIPV